MRTRFCGTEETAPDLGPLAFGPCRHMMDAIVSDPADLVDFGRWKAATACKSMRVVTWQDGDVPSLKGDRRLIVNLDQHPSRPNVMIADQRIRQREERRTMLGREFGVDAKLSRKSAVDDDPASQPPRCQYLVENVHGGPQIGVSVNLSGNPIILANRRPV